jgi:diguanylate cyclase (GGDEF)-like protein
MRADPISPNGGAARSDPVDSGTDSWLCRSDSDRERMLDMDQRLRPVRRAAITVLGVALIAGGPWIGYWTLAPLVVAAGLFALADSWTPRVERPEYVMFAAWVGAELLIAASVALSDATAATLSWLAIPVITLSARFSQRGVVAGVAVAVGLILAVAFGVDAAEVIDYPPFVFAPTALVIAVGILSTALMGSDVEHRSEAVIDQLTGMLNRKALAARTTELEQQSALTGQPVAILVGDIDRFKLVNDSHGHAAGDAVLKDVAYALRKQMRAFDLAYRLGGEEFLLLLPGTDREQAAAVGERLRKAVESRTVGDGHRVTISFGVSASSPGAAFNYRRVFDAADSALYESKRDGRNRVTVASEPSARVAVLADQNGDGQRSPSATSSRLPAGSAK